MPKIIILLLLNIIFISGYNQTKVARGEQPQLSVDPSGVIRLLYGETNKIYCSTSADNGATFSNPALIGEVSEMHLGMTRGPQLASSKDYSIVTAMDKMGNIHCFRLTHKTGKWEKTQNVNDVEASAPEGLMSLTAGVDNTFYAVWLDLREGRQNNICFSLLKPGASWIKNKIIYKSPESHVCECCKPSIAIKGKQVSVMFRNWLKGSRDLFFITSSDGGKNFSSARKLGSGTWQLKGCPMDGGGISIGNNQMIHTAWQRDGQVFYANPDQAEVNVGKGHGIGISGSTMYWVDGSELIVKPLNRNLKTIGQGSALSVLELKGGSILAAWEKDDQIMFETIALH